MPGIPINNVKIVITNKAGIQKADNGWKHSVNKRRNAANPAVLTTVDMKAVINVGEPS